jgi:hypothetical protein
MKSTNTMGRKSSAKSQTSTSPPSEPQRPKRSSTPLIAGIVAATLAVGGFAYLRQGTTPTESAAAVPNPVVVPAAVPAANMQPHKQASLPPLQFPGYAPPRPPDVVRAAYHFAAEHPEVLSYVPCFCGCERSGHRGNHDCFVRERAVNGDVIAWEDHGMECAVCIDVADRSRQLFAEGKSVADIRSAIEREWAGRMPSHTPTPSAPHSH